MKAKARKILTYGAIVAIILLLGYLREFVFVNVNFQLWHLYKAGNSEYLLPESLTFIKNLSYQQLYYGKWALTAAFTIGYFLVSIITLKVMFRERQFMLYAVYAFGIIIILAGLFYLYGMVFSDMKNGYALARIFMGIAQSPIILMVLIPAIMLAERQSRQ